jgi:large subunit ribosomal protein L6
MWGTVRAQIQNMVIGITSGFSKELILFGVGYKAAMKGQNLSLMLGYSHEIEYPLPKGIKVELVSPTEIKIIGIEKRLVGQVAAEI